jgi:hypothetical protein
MVAKVEADEQEASAGFPGKMGGCTRRRHSTFGAF